MQEDIPAGIRAAIDAMYEPLALLRGGGMATVIHARERALGREVVIKVLPGLASSDEGRARFKQEVLLAVALQHPQIVPVLTALEVDGAPAYVMPFVAGESLRERIRRGPRSVRETIAILLDVARALEHAHARGVVHRDIKPGNILLTNSSAVVTDFGIAKVRPARGRGPSGAAGGDLGSDPAAITREGVSLGTAAYMAPEQVVGDPAADHRVDLYALGMVAYEMLAGALPFAATERHRLLAAQLTERPAPLSRRRNDIPPGLDALIMRCLEKEPGARPATASVIVRTLQDADALARAPELTESERSHAPRRGWLTRSRDAFSTYVRRDVRSALHAFRRAPLLSFIAILSLALGIGANAAIFSLFNQLLLRPLPVAEPAQLVNLSLPGLKRGSTSCGRAGSCDILWSYPMFRDLEQRQTVLTGIAAHSEFGVSIAGNDASTAGDGLFISGSYFPVLGLQPAAGRLLGPSDDETIGANFVTVISHAFWLERFGGDPSVVGRVLQVNGRPMTVVGVAPRGFEGTTTGMQPIAYVPISMRGLFLNNPRSLERRTDYWIYLFGRLKPGVSIAEAQASLDGIVAPILVDVEAPLLQGVSDATRERFKAKRVALEEGARGQSEVHATSRAPMILLFGISGVVLLIACANIANLLLARGAGRSTEMGVRLALGANRRQLLVQLLTESLALSVAGGLLSLLVARWTLDGIASLLPAETSASLEFTLEPTVLVFAAVLALATGFAFGLFPALHSTRPDLISAIRAGAGQIAGGRAAARFRAALVTVQIALSMTLLISAGLFLKSLVNVSRVELGVAVEDMAMFTVSPTRAGYDTVRAKVLYGRIEDELRTIPGVNAVTSSLMPMLGGSDWTTNVGVQGFQSGPDINSNARFNAVGAGYFATNGIRLLAGRDFTPSDASGAARVAVVNEAFARKFGLGTDAVGKFIGVGSDSLDIQIVGLIKDAVYSSVKDSVPPLYYLPWRQTARLDWMFFYVKSAVPPEQLLTTIPAVLRRIDPALPLEQLRTMPQQIRQNVYLDRMISILSTAFAMLATLLAGVGLYGVLAYTVAQRTREIGVRMALGADAGRVRTMVLRQVGAMLLFGAVMGVVAAYVLGRTAQTLLYGLEGHDPLVFALAVLLLSLVALLAGYFPARRAALVDPMQALRHD